MKMAKMNIDCHRWVRVIYSDVGARDGIVLEKLDEGDFRIYFPRGSTDRVSREQIVEVGSQVELDFTKSGLVGYTK